MDEGIFVRYSWNKKAYKCYNLIHKKIVERINVKIEESRLLKAKKASKNPDILEYHINIKLKHVKEEEEEDE